MRSNPFAIPARTIVRTATLWSVATWRCPHCGTPQAESSRCWVCSQSPMTCSTCRNFRKGVVARVGFCALDRAHEPLTGDEIRACWQPPVQLEPAAGLFARVEAHHGSASDGPSLATMPARAPAAPIATTASEHPIPTVASPPRSAPASELRAAPASTIVRVSAHQADRVPIRTQAPDARPVGRLVEAPIVAPSLRLGSRGDARALREAAASEMPGAPVASSAAMTPRPSNADSLLHGEGRGLLDGGTVG